MVIGLPPKILLSFSKLETVGEQDVRRVHDAIDSQIRRVDRTRLIFANI